MTFEQWLDTLDEDVAELIRERAAIMEHDGGLSRAEAERAARAECLQHDDRDHHGDHEPKEK